MTIVKGCVVILLLGLLCLVGETLSSICCSFPTAVEVSCNRSTTTLPSSSVEQDLHSSEIAIEHPMEPISSDEQSDIEDGIGDPNQSEICFEYFCGTVQVEANVTYCSYEPCDPMGCYCTADCIDGSYRSSR